VLLDVRPEALNTGVVMAGLRCIDIDVDDPVVVAEILDKVVAHLPRGALIRRRRDSARCAMFYRAAQGQPTRRDVKGPNGKIEILGAGQQAVVHGLHPSGAPLTWLEGQGPNTVALKDLATVTEEQISNFLSACAPLLGGSDTEGTAPPTGPLGSRLLDPLSVPGKTPTPVVNELGFGIESPHWYSALSADEARALVKACLNVLDNRTIDPRDLWLRVIFAVADAEKVGCTDARQLALEWSQRGAAWTGEADFDTAWSSYVPKPGGVTIGTLLAMARDAGVDLSPWRDTALVRLSGQPGGTRGAATFPSSTPSGRALQIAQLPTVPPKRLWLHGVDLVRGAVSLLVAPGGRGKSSWLVALSLACASGRSLLGDHVFGGPLRVLLISAEDPTEEVARRLRAAMKHHGLTDADVLGLHVIGAERWGTSLLSPAANGPVLNRVGWDLLEFELDRIEPDVLILDPLISVMGGASQNDNAAAALFMGHLVGLAAKRRMAVMVAHHAAKGRDPVSAESAMGAASFVNLSRIALGIEPLAVADAGRLGLPPWEARDVFRVVGTKHNLSPPAETDRWFRLVSVELDNAQAPVYPNGDKVGVVEAFQPSASGPRFSIDIVRDALLAINNAATPLSPSKRAVGRYAVPVIARAIAPHRGGRSSDTEAQAVLDHLIRSALLKIEKVKVPRPGGRSDERDGLLLTSAGKQALQSQCKAGGQSSPQFPQPPARSTRDDAGGAPSGSPHRPGGYGGNTGADIAGTLAGSSTEVRHDNLTTRLFAAPAACSPAPSHLPAETIPTTVPEHGFASELPTKMRSRIPDPIPPEPARIRGTQDLEPPDCLTSAVRVAESGPDSSAICPSNHAETSTD
jgi:hypothetical protein